MSARAVLPARWHATAQVAYVAAGRATAPVRMRPSFVMVGASRAGTTSLFQALSGHPQVLRPTVNKGVHYFDVSSWRPTSWYYGHFPVRPLARQGWGDPVTFEASGYYMFHPFAIGRMVAELPDVKVVAMLRDPVERAYSSWKHERARGFEWETFEKAVELEDERLVGEVDRMRDPTYESFSHRHHAHRARGEYAEQLERIYSALPPERVFVMESEPFFARPCVEFQRLLAFLGLRDFLPARFDRLNARPSPSMPTHLRALLREHYRPHDERLADLLGRRTAWME